MVKIRILQNRNVIVKSNEFNRFSQQTLIGKTVIYTDTYRISQQQYGHEKRRSNKHPTHMAVHKIRDPVPDTLSGNLPIPVLPHRKPPALIPLKSL